MKTVPFDRVRAKALADPEAKAAYDALAPAFDIAAAVIRARKAARLTQEPLAERMGAKQPFIARIESAQAVPSLRTMMRIASATGTRFKPTFAPLHGSGEGAR